MSLRRLAEGVRSSLSQESNSCRLPLLAPWMTMNVPEVTRNGTSFFDRGLIPFKTYSYQTVLHSIALAICVPMNLIVAYVLISTRRLHKARNAIWLGVVGSNLITFFVMTLQYFVLVEQNYAACQLASFMFGKPYAILLINILLATCDRIIYTKWPLFHQRHVTVTRVVACQFICSALAFLVLNLPFLTGEKPIRCGMDPQNAQMTVGVIALLTFSCIVAKLVVYFMATEASNARRHGVVIRSKTIEQNSKMFVRELSRSSLRIHCGSRKSRLMEWNATMTLAANLIPMTLLASLSFLYMLSQSLCRNVFENCETLRHLEIYFREFAVFHVCTDLLVYIFRSLEFRSAIRTFIPNRLRRKT